MVEEIITSSKIYELGVVGKSLADKPAKERAEIKAEELAKIPLQNFFKDNIKIIVISSPKYNNGLLEVSVRAEKEGKELHINNPLQFKNPPIMIPDGTFYKGIDEFGNKYVVNNFKEDLPEALKIMIVQTIKVSNK